MVAFGCSQNSNAPFPTSKLSGDDVTFTPTIEEDKTISDVKITAIPEITPDPYTSISAVYTFESLDDLFAMNKYVVKGKVVHTSEIALTFKVGKEEKAQYFQVVDFVVEKSYGEAQLEYVENSMITFLHRSCSNYKVDYAIDFEVDGEYIVWLNDTEAEYFRLPEVHEFAKYLVSAITCGALQIIDDDMFCSPILLSLLELDPHEIDIDNTSVSEIEKLINEHIDKLRGLSYNDLLLEIIQRNNES